jgi:hypothetical protein
MSFTDYSMDRIFIPSKTSLISRYADYLILCLVATVGLIGSLYVFANRSLDFSFSNQVEANSLLPDMLPSHQTAVISRDKFDSLVRIEGDLAAGNELQITLIPDMEDARYYLDMGNKERIIITQQKFTYTYPKKGEFTIELKVLKNRLLSTIASKTIKVK